jgi:hypothetical protein
MKGGHLRLELSWPGPSRRTGRSKYEVRASVCQTSAVEFPNSVAVARLADLASFAVRR